MTHDPQRRRPAQALLLALPCIAAPLVGHASDTYNAVTDQLTIPVLHYGNAIFTDMVVTPGPPIHVGGGTPTGSEDAYQYFFGQGYVLEAPSVVVGSTTYTNVTATIAAMISVGGVSGADSYDGTYLYIPSVRAGNAFYNFVVITVAGIDGPPPGGFPKSGSDTYNSTTNQLTVPAVEYGGKAYTNVTLTPGRIVSVNGSANTGGPNSSVCYNPTYYATGTTMDLIYSSYEVKSLVLAPSTFNGVANAVGIQETTITSQGTSVATGYYDISSKFPVLLELGLSAGSSQTFFNPGVQFGGAITYGQALQTSGNLVYTGGSNAYTTDYVFEGFEDVTVPAGTFRGACKWSLSENIGQGPTKITTWNSHQGVLLKVGTVELQAGSTFNGGPLGN